MDDESKQELRGFNWGAAALGFFWSLRYSCFAKWAKAFCFILIIPAILIIGFWVLYIIIASPSGWSFLGAIVSAIITVLIQLIISCIILFVYSGIKSNNWLKSKNNLDIEQYKKEKILWNTSAIIFLIILAVSISGLIISCQIKSHNKKLAYQTREHLELKNDCTIIKGIVPPVIKNSKGKFDKDEFANNIAKNSQVKEVISVQAHSNNEYTVSFDVKNNDIGSYNGIKRIGLLIKYLPNCNFDIGNCYIEHKLYSNAEESCKFYFDKKGNAIPSVRTKKMLEE